uniref:Uncharacterized protein n=1 Tax=Ralstonia solanacearum TaxID=305 RepID=A0A0S4WEQ8_RALSL|nr:protein of unknown function [Ralstonia solanacearum]
MRRQRRHPVDGLGDVVGRQRLGSLVDLGHAGVIALEAHVRKLGARAQARLDVRHAHAGAGQVGAQVQRELAHESLGAAVYVAARVRIRSGDRAQVDDMAAVARHHARQQCTRHMHQPRDIGTDHQIPVGQAGPMRRLQAERQAGIVDQHVDLPPALRQGPRQGGDGGGILHIQQERQQRIAQFGFERIKAILAAARCDHAVPFPHETPRNGCPEAGRCAGHEYDHGTCLRARDKRSARV